MIGFSPMRPGAESGRRGPALNVAAGIHRIEDAYTNWFIVEEEGRLLIVDAGVPRSWDSLHEALGRLGGVAQARSAGSA